MDSIENKSDSSPQFFNILKLDREATCQVQAFKPEILLRLQDIEDEKAAEVVRIEQLAIRILFIFNSLLGIFQRLQENKNSGSAGRLGMAIICCCCETKPPP